MSAIENELGDPEDKHELDHGDPLNEDGPCDDEFGDDPTGPFCLHWGEPGLCVKRCVACRHACKLHLSGGPCTAKDCECEEMTEDTDGEEG